MLERHGEWVEVATLADFAERDRRIVKVGRKQIALFKVAGGEAGDRFYACNNRCPHEGYPLVEGSLTEPEGSCVLTCNWHNWKFDLDSGETLTGGDRLRRYPVLQDGERLLVDVTDPPAEARQAQALENLRDSFRKNEVDRMAREIARLTAAGGDPLDAVRNTIAWTHDRFEDGMTHAAGAAPDWLALAEEHAWDAPSRLAPLVETVSHFAWDSLREPTFPFTMAVRDYAPDALLAAIEREDEEEAVALLRGALAAGLRYGDLFPVLARAALAHYLLFGHAAIYLVQCEKLLARLGPAVETPLLLSYLRMLIMGWREDLLPEFRGYGASRAAWDGSGEASVTASDFASLGVRAAFARVLESSGRPHELFTALFGACAWQLLHLDLGYQNRTDGPVSQNAGWLDVTHGITFGRAVYEICTRRPELWPDGLLQMACFVGRNNDFVDPSLDAGAWRVDLPERFLVESFRSLFDHGQAEPIVSAHLVKTLTAAAEQLDSEPEAPWKDDLLAGLNRFLNSPLKRKHLLRMATQSLAFVEAEG